MKDEKLITAIRQGDEHAINHAINKYARLLWSIAGAALEGAATAEDVEECVADVFVYLWQHPEKYDPARGKLKVWLSILARSIAIDRRRQLSRHAALPLEEALTAALPDLAEGISAQEDRERLAGALESLEAPDRDILLRRYIHSQKPREIALALGIPVKQVDNRLYRAKQRLRALLTDQKGGLT